jgi:hypothetical protein
MSPACRQTGKAGPLCPLLSSPQLASGPAAAPTTPRPLAPNAQKGHPGPTGRRQRRQVRPGGVRWPTAHRRAPRSLPACAGGPKTGPDIATNSVWIRGCSRGPRGPPRLGRNHRRPSVGFVRTSEACLLEDPCRREGLLSVLSVIFKGISKVFGMHAHLRAALEEGRHSPHISSVYSSLRGGQTQFGFGDKVYLGVVVRK